MKKHLALKTTFTAACLLCFFSNSFAGTDPAEYYEVSNISCENKWLISRGLDESEWLNIPFAEQYNKVRNATIYGEGENTKIVFGYSKTMTINELNNDYAHISIFNLQTGLYENEVQLTYNGEYISGLLCANEIGTDNYGNLWIIGTHFSGNTFKVFRVKDINTGDCSLEGEISIPDSIAYNRLYDYDIVGDITGQKSHAILMSSSSTSGSYYIYRWKRDKGVSNTEWKGDFNGAPIINGQNLQNQNGIILPNDGWGSSNISIVDDETNSASNYIIDGIKNTPICFNIQNGIIGSFTNSDLAPYVTENGVAIFKIKNKTFIAYTIGPYNIETYSNRINIAEIEDYTLSNLQLYWTLPKLKFSSLNDTGTRNHCIWAKNIKDSNGNEGVYLLTYKSNNGLGLYLIAENGFNENLTVGINEPLSENIKCISRYNIFGQPISVPTHGINILKMSDGTTKKEIIR